MTDDTSAGHPAVTAIVLAGGSGVRMGAGMPKALMPLAGRPLLAWSLAAVAAAGIEDVVLVAPRGDERPTEMALGDEVRSCTVVPGGENRGRSLEAGLAAADPDAEIILVHDAARPLLTSDLVARAIEAVGDGDGAVVAAPATDTLKIADEDLEIVGTADRERHWRAQTPQVFRAETFRAAVVAAAADGFIDEATDCSAMVERAGGRVRVVPNPAPNIKVTTPADLEIAARLLTP